MRRRFGNPQLLLRRPPRRELEVALELSGQRAEGLGAPVVLEVELTRPVRVEVPPEPVGLDLRRFRANPVLWTPGDETVALVGSGGLGERAEERVDAEAVGEHLTRPVAVIGNPGQVRGSDVLRLGDRGKAFLREEPAGRRPPLPETPPHGE